MRRGKLRCLCWDQHILKAKRMTGSDVGMKLLVRGESGLQMKMSQLQRQHYLTKLDQSVTYSGTGEEGGHTQRAVSHLNPHSCDPGNLSKLKREE